MSRSRRFGRSQQQSFGSLDSDVPNRREERESMTAFVKDSGLGSRSAACALGGHSASVSTKTADVTQPQ